MYVYSWGENARMTWDHFHATELPVFCQLTLKRLGLVPYQFSNEYR